MKSLLHLDALGSDLSCLKNAIVMKQSPGSCKCLVRGTENINGLTGRRSSSNTQRGLCDTVVENIEEAKMESGPTLVRANTPWWRRHFQSAPSYNYHSPWALFWRRSIALPLLLPRICNYTILSVFISVVTFVLADRRWDEDIVPLMKTFLGILQIKRLHCNVSSFKPSGELQHRASSKLLELFISL